MIGNAGAVAGGPRGAASARHRIEALLDAGTFRAWDPPRGIADDPLGFVDSMPYAERLAKAREATGLDEAVITGSGELCGRLICAVATEFDFLGGTMGVAVGAQVSAAFDRARDERRPLVALLRSGGARMQEGALALVQMARTAAATRRFLDAGLLYVSWLGDPSMGGAHASWGALGSVTLAEPGARIGFYGPRVVEALVGSSLPPEEQGAGRLLELGLVDELVAFENLRERLAGLLDAVDTGGRPPRPASADLGKLPTSPRDGVMSERDPWEACRAARDPLRPGAQELANELFETVLELRGDGTGRDDPGVLARIARFDGRGVVVVGQVRSKGRPPEPGPAAFRKARRAMHLAGRLGLPLVNLIDTPHAELSAAAENGGLAREVAACLAELSALRAPSVAVLLGEGGSGAALALAATDRVICAENATLAVIAPEGASAILHRDREHAAELARSLAMTAPELRRMGLVDRVVSEPKSAAEDPAGFTCRMRTALAAELAAIEMEPLDALLARRAHHWEGLRC